MTQPVIIAKGAFADVWDLQNGKVLKAFRSESRAHGEVVDIQDHDLLTSVYCAQEANAYKKLKGVANVQSHLPDFYGKQDPIDLLPKTNTLYVKDAGFIIQKLEGRDQKIAHLSKENQEAVEPILWQLSENLRGLNVWDCSCFYKSNNSFKLIDFALWDASDYQCHLYDHGRLTKEQRKILNGLAATNNAFNPDAKKDSRPLT